MGTFVLVHGAWLGGWCWRTCSELLRRDGHQVFAPSLTGLGDRRHLLRPDIDLQTHVADVVNLIESEELSDVVLCGHSYGGMVVTGAADQASERIRALVYLDALVPKSGQSVADLIGAPKPSADPDAWKMPPMTAAAWGVMSAADAEWVDRRCTPHPAGTFTQPLTLGDGIGRIRDKTYIWASKWGPAPPLRKSYEDAQAAGWSTREFACGHSVMIDRPAELARELVAVDARRV